MRNSTLSRLALLGLASVSSVAFAASKMSGEIRFDARFTVNQKTSADVQVAESLERNDNLFISRARLDFCGDVAKDWMYGMRLEYPEDENDQIGIDPSVTGAQSGIPFTANTPIVTSIDAAIARAYVCWKGLEGINIKMGRIGTPEITSDRLYYMPYIGKYPNNRAVGSAVNYSGDHAGFAVDGAAGPIGYSFGIWKQTDLRNFETVNVAAGAHSDDTLAEVVTLAKNTVTASSFDSKSLRYGFGGRLTFAQEMKNGTAFGVGVGYNRAPLNMPVVINLVERLGQSGSHSPLYSQLSFNDLSNFAVDASATFKSFQVNAGYQDQTLSDDVYLASSGATATDVNGFQQNGKATAWWVELGYLIMGEGYKLDAKNAAISGVKLREKQAGLEVTARYGHEVRKNALALLSTTGFEDFNTDAAGTSAATRAVAEVVAVADHNTDRVLMVTVDNTVANVMSTGNTVDIFEERMGGFAFGLNYYMAENAVIKLEYESRSNDFKRDQGPTTWTDSLNAKNIGTVRVRADYSF